jgi:hypothetical protein
VKVEDMDFGIIMEILNAAVSPHNLDFKRHDYIQNMTTGVWESFQELRSMVRPPGPACRMCSGGEP